MSLARDRGHAPGWKDRADRLWREVIRPDQRERRMSAMAPPAASSRWSFTACSPPNSGPDHARWWAAHIAVIISELAAQWTRTGPDTPPVRIRPHARTAPPIVVNATAPATARIDAGCPLVWSVAIVGPICHRPKATEDATTAVATE